LAVVSPFLGKSFGTERVVIEWLDHLPDIFEIHVYSQHVEDLNPGFRYHRVPKIPGPHLLRYLWWFIANRFLRSMDTLFNGLRYDLVYSPGVNCLDADVISVHIVFAKYLRQAHKELKFSENPISSWLRLAHRKVYYRLIVALEKRLYSDRNTTLVLCAKKTAKDLERFYGRSDPLPVLYFGIDHSVFNPVRRAALREKACLELGIPPGRFVVLMVGNDLRNKGIASMLAALAKLRHLPIDFVAAGRENPTPFQAMVRNQSLQDRVRFLPARNDVEFYYAAADAYAGPSLEDTFALPPAEAMACGLPVIVSAENGTCEIITHQSDGLILQDATDSETLAEMIRKLYEDRNFSYRLGANAAKAALKYTWDSNGRELGAIFAETLRRKAASSGQTQIQESQAGDRGSHFSRSE
jgi:UDP-glucose:(heptosyl)LPS alpha-1,3-glucosyltransferase